MGNADSFLERTDILKERIGEGTLHGSVTYGTAYAIPIHESHWENFMGRYGYKRLSQHTGEPKFLEATLYRGYRRWLQRLADAVRDGSSLDVAMGENMLELKVESQQITPVRTTDLRRSAEEHVERL